MTPKQVIKYFGSQANASRALRVSTNAVSKWYIAAKIPRGRQFEIAVRFPDLKVDRVFLKGEL